MGIREKLLADRQRFLLKAIQRCGTQKELSARTGFKRSKINFLLNRAKEIRYEDALLIANASEGAVSPFQLADHLDAVSKHELMADSRFFNSLKISERVRLAQAHEVELKRLPPGRIKGRVEKFAANMAQFGNYKTYQQAKQIIKSGIPQLISAMDTKRLKIFTLSQMSHYTPQQQLELLNLSHRQINAWMRHHPVPASVVSVQSPSSCNQQECSLSARLWLSSDVVVARGAQITADSEQLFQLLKNRQLFQAERRIGWPLRLLGLCLAYLADSDGQLAVEWETLCQILLEDNWDVAAAIKELIALNWLRKSPFEEET